MNLKKVGLAILPAIAVAWGRAEAQSVVFRAVSLDGTSGWYSVPLEGGKVTAIDVGDFGAFGAAWAPNGSTVILKKGAQDPVTGACCDLLTAYGAPAGTPVVPLTIMNIPWRMSVSADSSTVVFVGDYTDLYTVPVAGGAVAKLTASDANWLLSPSWSPDGTQIAFLREVTTDPVTGATVNQLAVISAAGGTVRAVLGGVGIDRHLPSWSPDGKTIATLLASGDVVLVDVASGNVVPLTTGRVCEAPSFSPDGSRVTAVCWRDGAALMDLIVFPVSPAGDPVVLAVDATNSWGMGPSWAPDSQRIAYVTGSGWGWPGFDGVTVIDLAGVPTEVVPQGASNATISTVMVQPAVPTPTVSVVSAKLDYLGERLVVEATSPRNGKDALTLLGHGAMTWSSQRRRWTATAIAPTAWESLGVCGLDGCVFVR